MNTTILSSAVKRAITKPDFSQTQAAMEIIQAHPFAGNKDARLFDTGVRFLAERLPPFMEKRAPGAVPVFCPRVG